MKMSPTKFVNYAKNKIRLVETKKKFHTRKIEASNERKVRLRNAPNPILSWSPNVAYE